jgi:hypothetical protein
MKFIQRTAVAPPSSPAPPSSGDRSSKRRRLDNSSPAAGLNGHELVTVAAVQAAIQEDEDKRRAALEKHRVELADTQWVVDATTLPRPSATALRGQLNVVHVGYADIDGSARSDDYQQETRNGRRKVGNYQVSSMPS